MLGKQWGHTADTLGCFNAILKGKWGLKFPRNENWRVLSMSGVSWVYSNADIFTGFAICIKSNEI